MEKRSLEYEDYFFVEKSNRREKEYDYLWCSSDTNMHRHVDFYELFFVIGGISNHQYEGKTVKIKKKQMFFFRPGETHRLYSDDTNCFHFTFFAKKVFFEQWFQKYPIFKDVFGGSNSVSCEMTDTEFEFIFKLINTMTHQNEEELKVTLFLFNVLSLLILQKEDKRQKANVLNHVLDIVEKINNYMYLTCKVSEIYKNYPIAQCTLIREFKKHTGKTIVQYQREQKMAYASRMLINQADSVTDISEQLQFGSFSHFLHTFKDYYGMTPKEYRRTHRRPELLNEEDVLWWEDEIDLAKTKI